MLSVDKRVDHIYTFKFYMEPLLCRKDQDHWDIEGLIIFLKRSLFLRSR